MSSIRSDPNHIHPEPVDHLPDSIVLLIFNRIGDVKDLGRCCVVLKRFQSLVPEVENVVVRVDYVISDDDPSSTAASNSISKSCHPISSFFGLFLSGIFKFVTPPSRRIPDCEIDKKCVTHHSPTQVLKDFN